jgi:hypothetical protein
METNEYEYSLCGFEEFMGPRPLERCQEMVTVAVGVEKMKRILKAIGSGILLFVALFVTIGWSLFILLWMLVIGDTHEEVWRVLPYVFVVLSGSISISFVCLDLMEKTSRTSRKIRLVFSVLVCLLVLTLSLHAEAKRIKGWSSEGAALSVASSIYPDLADSFVLKVESEENVSALTRGPNITYVVLSGEEPVCRLTVCRRYWSYWTCGMHETLKDRNANP